MKPTPISLNEDQRLAEVETYELSNENYDFGMDEIVQLTIELFKVPILLVSIFEKEIQFFKVRIGIELSAIQRSISFCDHALGLDDILEVPDTLQDTRFALNPLVTGPPNIRFYAGIPLRSPGGHILGTFCIMDTIPRGKFSFQEHINIRSLARLVLDKLESRRLALAHAAGKSRFLTIAETSPDAVICTDNHSRIVFWNQSCERLLGHRREAVLDANIEIIFPQHMREVYREDIRNIYEVGHSRILGKTIEIDVLDENGNEIPVEFSLSTWEEAGLAGLGIIIRDIRTRRADEKRMYKLAYIDDLSGLPNRGVLMSRIAELEAVGQPFAVLIINLDGFKDVNDSLGHHAGDAVIREIAGRLTKFTSATDTLARLGGDEFVLLLPITSSESRIGESADLMLAMVAAPINIDGQEIHLTGSIGVSLFPEHSSKLGDILSAANLALSTAKADGRNCVRLYAPVLRYAILDRRASAGDIRRAIEREEFEVFYQPQVRPSDGTLLGVEALLRWRHPTEGLLTPARFLSTLEAGPFAVDVGRWVMETACLHAVALRHRVKGLTMGVNLFGAQFRTGKLASEVCRILEKTGLPPHALELEITENIILRHDDVTLEPLQNLRAIGVDIAFDDFGTGYASLSLLKRYPLTRLKIDRSFIQSICSDCADAAIVNAVIAMASSLKLNVIAEGVETTEQRDLLLASGCNAIQGYLCGRPMALADLHILISNWNMDIENAAGN